MCKRFMKLSVLTALLLMVSTLTAVGAPACCSTNIPASTNQLTGSSLYQVESVWTSDHGREFKLSQLRGRVQIVTMFFSSCQYACPILVHDMKKIEAELKQAGLTNVGFVLVTMDIERDTVERLYNFRQGQSLNDDWLLLRGGAEDTLEIAALLGMKYKKEANGQFAHSNIITVVNAEGEIVHQQVGLNVDPSSTVATVKKTS